MKRFWFWPTMLVVVALALAGGAQPAEGAFAIRVTTSGANGIFTVNDNQAGVLDSAGVSHTDLDPINNSISLTPFNVTDGLGNVLYRITVTAAVSNSPGGASAMLDLQYNVTSANLANPLSPFPGGSVTIEASATGYLVPATGTTGTLLSLLNGNGSGTGSVTAQQFTDLSNALFGESGGTVKTPGVQGPFAINTYSNSATTSYTSATPYSLTEKVTITLGSNSNTSADFQSEVTAIPAPGGLVLTMAGLPLLGVGAWIRRRLRKE